jgi:hypothetical protein
MKLRCKFCPQESTSWDSLKEHIMTVHPVPFLQVQAWLGRTTEPKIKVFERTAREGMLGANAKEPHGA